MKKSIGILLISTWKYNKYIDQTISGIRRYFFPNSNVKIYLHTDSDHHHDADVVIKIKHQPWPLITLNRFNLFQEYKETYSTDYLIYLDIDSDVVGTVNEDILCDFFATEHSGLKGTKGTPENNPKSSAYIAPNKSIIYVCGGFYGGKKENFLNATKIMRDNVQKDLDNNIVALWHDESHLNRYVFDNKDKIKIIDHSYMYFITHSKFPTNNPKIIPCDKNFNKFEKNIN